jgi:hypothetical protein
VDAVTGLALTAGVGSGQALTRAVATEAKVVNAVAKEVEVGTVVGETTEARAFGAANKLDLSASRSFDDVTVAVLKDGYYEVSGFRFSEYYYKKLWSTGRGAPSLVAKEILASGVKGTPDASKAGFLRYDAIGWEMVYNPTTREVWHIQPTK